MLKAVGSHLDLIRKRHYTFIAIIYFWYLFLVSIIFVDVGGGDNPPIHLFA